MGGEVETGTCAVLEGVFDSELLASLVKKGFDIVRGIVDEVDFAVVGTVGKLVADPAEAEEIVWISVLCWLTVVFVRVGGVFAGAAFGGGTSLFSAAVEAVWASNASNMDEIFVDNVLLPWLWTLIDVEPELEFLVLPPLVLTEPVVLTKEKSEKLTTSGKWSAAHAASDSKVEDWAGKFVVEFAEFFLISLVPKLVGVAVLAIAVEFGGWDTVALDPETEPRFS